MPAINQPYTHLLILAALVPAILTVVVLRQHLNLGARSFALKMAAVSLWAFVSLFEVCSRDPQTKIFSYQIKYLFIVLVPPSWLIFSLYFTNRLRKLNPVQMALLLTGPGITLLLVATNHLHHQMFTRFEIVEIDSYQLLYPHFGPLFWLHVLYSYSLIGIGFVYLSKHFMNTRSRYRRQAACLLVGGLVPWLSNIAFIYEFGPMHHFDFTPVLFSVSGAVFMWGILRYKALDIVPFAQDEVIRNMKDGVIIVDENNRILHINASARRLAGITQDHVIGTPADRIIPWWSSLNTGTDRTPAADQPVLQLSNENQMRYLQFDQSSLNEKDKQLGTMFILRDVTATKLAQEAMRDSEKRFKSLSENAPVIIFSLDENGRLNYTNPAWETLLGHGRREVMGLALAEFISENNVQTIGQTFNQLIDGQLPTAELNLQMKHKDGSNRLFNTSASANTDTEGRVTGIIGLAKDVTEEKRLEQQLFQSQKMEAIGTLAGGIAHDFNNLLMGMQANLSLLRLERDQPRAFEEKCQRIEDQIQNGADLTRQLLGYAHKGKYSDTIFDLNELVEDTLNVVRRTNKNIIVKVNLNVENAWIGADQGQIELVLLNLFLNAVDAMPGGGELAVTSTVRPRLEKDRAGHDKWVELSIADTGTGMDKATLNRIFEPFFTTKEIGHGTGLGLASVYGVIQNHAGNIDVSSELGQGTIFTISLPHTAPPEALSTAFEHPAGLKITSARVLLVDDEPLILKYSHEMMTSLGVSVLSTECTTEAVRLYQESWNDIDLVILDVVMPKMDGIQLFRIMEKINPQIRAIMTTGYAMDDRVSTLISSGRHHFLKKPYSRKNLATAISSLMREKTALAEEPEVKTI